MIVKCCGLNPTRDVQICLDLKVNFLGFIFYKKSPRNIKISDLDILKNYNRRNSLFTAVTVNANNEMIDQISSKNIQCIQLHGSETIERQTTAKYLRYPSSEKIPEEAGGFGIQLIHGGKTHRIDGIGPMMLVMGTLAATLLPLFAAKFGPEK